MSIFFELLFIHNISSKHDHETTASLLRKRRRTGHFRVPPGPLFQNEGRCSAFDMEIIFHSHANKTHFHKKGCAPSLILKVRVFGPRKWPILLVFHLVSRNWWYFLWFQSNSWFQAIYKHHLRKLPKFIVELNFVTQCRPPKQTLLK